MSKPTVEDLEIALSLTTPEGFNERVFYHAKTTKTQTTAYWLTEEEHYKVFKRYRYSSWNSYRNCRNKLIIKKRKLNAA